MVPARVPPAEMLESQMCKSFGTEVKRLQHLSKNHKCSCRYRAVEPENTRGPKDNYGWKALTKTEPLEKVQGPTRLPSIWAQELKPFPVQCQEIPLIMYMLCVYNIYTIFSVVMLYLPVFTCMKHSIFGCFKPSMLKGSLQELIPCFWSLPWPSVPWSTIRMPCKSARYTSNTSY